MGFLFVNKDLLKKKLLSLVSIYIYIYIYIYTTVKNFSQANKGATASGGSVRFPVQTSQHNRV